MQAIIVNGTAKEVAALALEMQGRQMASTCHVQIEPVETIRGAVRSAIGGIAEKSQDSLLP